MRKIQVLLVLIILLLLAACSPAKRVLKDQRAFDEIAQEVIRRGYCAPQDSVVRVDTVETVVERAYAVQDSVLIPVTEDCRLDETTPNGFRVHLSPERGLQVSFTGKIPEKVVTIHTEIKTRDASREALLERDLSAVRVKLEFLTQQLDHASQRVALYGALSAVLCVLLALLGARALYTRLTRRVAAG